MAKQKRKMYPEGGKVGVKDGKLKQAYEAGTPLKNIYDLPSDASDYQKLLATQSTQDAMNRARWANFSGKMTDYPSGRTVPSFQYTPGVLKEMERKGLTRDYIESWQPDNYPEEFSLGGILGSFGKGAASGALSGSAVPGLGTLAGGIIGGIGGLFGGIMGHFGEKKQEKQNAADQLRAKGMAAAEQKRYDEMMANQQPEIVEDPSQNLTGMNMVTNQYAPTFPMGGQVETQLAELETGEPFRSPDGKIGVVKSDDKLSHKNGGVTMPLEVGTQILGKDKDPDTKKTFKEMGRKLAQDKQKYEKILTDNKGTYARNAAKAMNSKIDADFTVLFQKQEALKPQSQQGIPQQFADGGGIFGNVGKGLNLLGGGDLTKISAAGAGVGGMNPASGGGGFLSNLWQGAKGAFQGAGGFGGLLNKGMQLAPIGYNLMQGMQPAEHLNAQDFYNPQAGQALGQYDRAQDLMSNRRFDIDPMLQGNIAQQSIGDYNARTQGGLSAGAVASNRLANMAQRMRSDQSAYSQQQNVQNQYAGQQAQMLGQAAQFRAGLGQQQASTDFNVANINQQADAARRTQFGAGMTGLSDYAQMQQLMQGQQGADQQRMAALQGLFPMFQQWFPGASGK